MTKYLLALVLFIGIAYGSVEAWPLIVGPVLRVDAPADHESFPGGVVTIRGTAKRVSALTLNGAPLRREEDGAFSATLAFPPGESILTLVATDRFGRRVTETRTIFVP